MENMIYQSMNTSFFIRVSREGVPSDTAEHLLASGNRGGKKIVIADGNLHSPDWNAISEGVEQLSAEASSWKKISRHTPTHICCKFIHDANQEQGRGEGQTAAEIRVI